MYRRGFTLIELVIVIAVVGLLSTVAITALTSVREKSRVNSGLSFHQSAEQANYTDAVGIWSFDTIEAGSTEDESGNNHNGNVVGATLTEGILGNALEFKAFQDDSQIFI